MYAQRKDKNESIIIEALERAGAYCIQMDRVVGFDLLVMHDGKLYVMEIKAPGKEQDLTEREQKIMREVEAVAACTYHIVSSVEQALEIIGR